MTNLNVSEIFYSIQGEGKNAGRPAVFLRLSACNLWKNKDVPSKSCPYCDTPALFNSTEMSMEYVLDKISALMIAGYSKSTGLVITGGEPMLQLTPEILHPLIGISSWVDIETNGTISIDAFDLMRAQSKGSSKPINFSCSPKTSKFISNADQYKVLVPNKTDMLDKCMYLTDPSNIYLQPVEPKVGIESSEYKENLNKTITLALDTGCRVCLQQHKYLNVR